ncbi:hypothetical protein GCM10010170_076540 [Dactylosporangium salmoneum]|uniref:Uncharacterized protein n=2 Tax=Dactylosporangium salmoneum TaxID=53361 RepID=A0ABN3HA37_9ACTN
MGRATPVGRLRTLDDVAAVVAFVAVPEASYVSGQTLIVDGANPCRRRRVADVFVLSVLKGVEAVVPTGSAQMARSLYS